MALPDALHNALADLDNDEAKDVKEFLDSTKAETVVSLMQDSLPEIEEEEPEDEEEEE